MIKLKKFIWPVILGVLLALEVKNIDTKDGVKLYFTDNASWILIRPSGTEPLLRIYFESDSKDKLVSMINIFA